LPANFEAMISRRKFFGTVSGATASWLAFHGRAAARWPEPAASRPICGLVDLPGNCLQRESFVGYREALAGLGVETLAVTPDVLGYCGLIIIPAASALSDEHLRQISQALRGGAFVLFESAAGFMEEEKVDSSRLTLFKHWGVSTQSPVHLRAGERGQGRVPYVDFIWPLRAKVRDFSRVVPVCAREDETITEVDGWRVGLKRKVGAGTLIFLGSLLGPALGAQDREARGWLREVLRFSMS
jgi:hypothetical protein